MCFNEGNPNQILCAGGDGSLKLFDVSNNMPVKILKEHAGEVFGCEWNHINKKKILSASYDKYGIKDILIFIDLLNFGISLDQGQVSVPLCTISLFIKLCGILLMKAFLDLVVAIRL